MKQLKVEAVKICEIAAITDIKDLKEEHIDRNDYVEILENKLNEANRRIHELLREQIQSKTDVYSEIRDSLTEELNSMSEGEALAYLASCYGPAYMLLLRAIDKRGFLSVRKVINDYLLKHGIEPQFDIWRVE